MVFQRAIKLYLLHFQSLKSPPFVPWHQFWSAVKGWDLRYMIWLQLRSKHGLLQLKLQDPVLTRSPNFSKEAVLGFMSHKRMERAVLFWLLGTRNQLLNPWERLKLQLESFFFQFWIWWLTFLVGPQSHYLDTLHIIVGTIFTRLCA